MSDLLSKFEEFGVFCLEHGGTLRNHRQFGKMYQELREDLTTAQEENKMLREKVERAFFDGIIFYGSGKHCGGTTGALKEAKEYAQSALNGGKGK